MPPVDSLVSALPSEADAPITRDARTASIAPYDCFCPPDIRVYRPSGDTSATPPSKLSLGTRM